MKHLVCIVFVYTFEPTNNNNMKTLIAFAIKTFYLSFIVTGFILAIVNSL